jgi:carbon-monoxide dehydrogenase catalytic subunit
MNRRGICGITADGMAMRMLRNLLGASTYHYHTDQTVKTLRATAKGETPFEIREYESIKVKFLAGKVIRRACRLVGLVS